MATYYENLQKYNNWSDAELDAEIALIKSSYQDNLKLLNIDEGQAKNEASKGVEPEAYVNGMAKSLKAQIDSGDTTYETYLRNQAIAGKANEAGADIGLSTIVSRAKLGVDEFANYAETQASKTGFFGAVGGFKDLKSAITDIKADPGFGSMSNLATTIGETTQAPTFGGGAFTEATGMENVIGAGQKPGQTLALHALGSAGTQNALAQAGGGAATTTGTTASGVAAAGAPIAAGAGTTAATTASAALPYVIGGSSLLSGYMGTQAAKDASEASAQATQVATGEQGRQFDLARADTAVARGAGESATYALMDELGMNYGAETGALDPESQLPTFGGGGQRFEFDLEADPGYRFARDEGVSEVSKYMASKGKRDSGNVLAAIGDRTAGIASQYADQAFNRQMAGENVNYGRDVGEFGIDYQRAGDIYGRRENYLNRLGSMAGMGQTATGMSIGAGGNMANAIGNIQMANAQAQGGAAGTKYGAINDAVQGGVGNWLAYQQQQNLMNRPMASSQPPVQYLT